MKNPKQLQTDFRATVGMLNPPYSQGSKQDSSLYEIAFTEHLLDSLLPNSRCAVIVPQSSMTGKTNEEQQIKESILKNHTLEGVIMLQKDTFYGIGVIPCIAVFTSGQPHPKDKICKFINFEDDGFKVSPHVGLLETEAAKDKKQHLLDVWFDRIEAENKFCVKTTVNAQDEWLHSFYYFNDEIPTDADFEKTVGDYLSFEFSMIMQGRRYLFENVDSEKADNVKKNFKLSDREWKEFKIGDLFDRFEKGNITNSTILNDGEIPYIGATNRNNGVIRFVEKNDKTEKKGNCIVFISQGDGSAGYSIYRESIGIYAGTVICAYKRELNMQKGLFISSSSDMSESKYSHGYPRNEKRLRRDIVMLPVSETGEPDYDFMENYIHELEQEKLSEYKTYAQKQVCELSYQEIELLENKEWKAFLLTDLFDTIQRGKRLTKENQKDGSIPYVSSSAQNNGVDNYISNTMGVRFFENCLSLANSGSVGSCFYEPFKFVASDHITHLKNSKNTKYSYLFTATLLNRLSQKYNFNREINDKRISNEIIILPITSDGKPDYAYMEQYTKNLMLRKYCEYLDYKFKKSQTIYSFSAPYFLVAEKS